ncbi:hypothetical protein, partial [Streptomyces sp. AK02-04a]|uniref:hypothetical protein n=1 Tax=Streptomyces sp. AK02-04a TaxID=3028649 RepID=UPI0029ACF5F5
TQEVTMAMSRIAQEFAAEIAQHDWSDAPWRIDRAGHNRNSDSPSRRTEKVLGKDETDRVRTNVMWVVAQVLGHSDPNFDVHEFADACGLNTRKPAARAWIDNGLRAQYGQYMRPGTWRFDPLTEVVTTNSSDAYHATTKCPLFQIGHRKMPIRMFPAAEVPAKWKPYKCVPLNRT